MLRLLLFVLLNLCSFATASGQISPQSSVTPKSPNSPSEANEGTTIEKSVFLKGRGITKASIDLGDHKPGTEIQCELDVLNLAGRTIRFDQVRSGCGCLSVTPNGGTFLVDDGLRFSAIVKAPTRPRKVHQSATFTGLKDNAPVFVIRLEYQLIGVVGFSGESVQVRVPKGCGELDVTVDYFTDLSVPPEAIEFELGKGLEGIKGALVSSEKYIKLTIPEHSVSSETLAGEIRIINKETGFADSIPLRIQLHQSLALFPSKIRFFDSEGNDDQCTASLMIVDRNREPSDKHPTVLEATIDGIPLQCKVVRAQGQITHYKIIAKKNLMEGSREKPHLLSARLSGKQSVRSLTIPFSHGKTSLLKAK